MSAGWVFALMGVVAVIGLGCFCYALTRIEPWEDEQDLHATPKQRRRKRRQARKHLAQRTRRIR